MPKKLTLQEAKLVFELGNCTLLEENYINSQTPMKYICECDDESFISYSEFKSGGRCVKCGISKRSESQRLPYKEVSDYFYNENCILLDKTYKNTHTIMNYICSCSNTSKISFSNFKAGNRCEDCGINKRSESRRLPFEFIKNFFEENSCELLDNTYINGHEPMNYRCSCGNKSTISFSAFQSGQRCRKCGIVRSAEKQKTPYYDVKYYFEEQGCKLLEDKYINGSTPMEYICSCGNKSKIKFSKFKAGQRCWDCGVIKSSNGQKLPYEDVAIIFEKEGCKLLETDYLNNRTKMKYICSCGNESEVSLDKFQAGQRCYECSIERRSGENHHNWLGGISDLNQHLRTLTVQWKKDTLKNSNYRCDITDLRSKDLVVHHLYPFNKIVKQTIEIVNLPILVEINQYNPLDLELIENTFIELHSRYGLGILLLESIHEEFHNKYGYIDFTPQDFEEFKQNKILQLSTKSAS